MLFVNGFLAALIVCSTASATAPTAGPATPPVTKKIPVTETIHGVEIVDNYRWLEANAKEDPAVAAWVEAENKVTFDYLESIPQRDAIRKRLTELWNYEKFNAPRKKGGLYFTERNDGLQNQYVLYVQSSLDAEPRVLLDPNTWSKDGTIALRGYAISDDAQLIAYGKSEAGSDWQTWRVRNIETGEDLADELRWVKFSGASWTNDGKGFFYSRYDEPKKGEEFQSVNTFQKLYYHRIGTEQQDDVLVYHRPDEPYWGFGSRVTEDGRYLVITISKGTDDKYRIMYKDLTEPYGLPIDLITDFEADYTFIGNAGPTFYFRTNLDAPLGKLIAIDIRRPEKAHRKELIPETKDTLRSVNLVGNLFIAEYLADAKSAVRIFTESGQHLRDVAFDGIGSASGFGGERSDTETFYSFSSFATPPRIYRYDIITGESDLLRQADVDIDSAAYEVKQVFFTSKDGTRVPMFITHRKDISLDGSNPTLLYGYGGFNIPLTPGFSISRALWLEMGGIYAVANLRGGGEYGEKWHKAGTVDHKQNVFDDFIAAAEWLIDNNYTSSEKLAIQGGSNGGLLVGACITQRPELYGAALPAVGVLDMLRFHKFTIGWAWVDDYGSADDADQFPALFAYSPYHNIKPGTEYPPTLITTGDTDDRVVPGHSFKFAAALQAAHVGDNPVLIRIETRAGHGAGKPTEKIIEEIADQIAFLYANLGMTYKISARKYTTGFAADLPF